MSRKKKNAPGGYKKELTRSIFEIFDLNPSFEYNYKQLASRLNINDVSQRKLINEILIELELNDYLVCTQRGRYKLKASIPPLEGRISFTQRGSAYVIIDGVEEDIFIHQTKTGRAFNDDIVRISTFNRNGRIEGEVTEIVKRAKSQYVGTVDKSDHAVFVRPDDRRMPVDFFIEKGHLKGANDGDKVIVKLLSWPSSAKSPLGGVVEVLGRPGKIDVEMHSILAEYGFPIKFPDWVEKAAEKIKEADYEKEVKNRRDFRNVLTFTIDPHDAKDFDDALSYKELENGNIEVGIHIADVSHYVQPDSELDKEALHRGNSVYLVDRVIPMLPEVLSNGLCSLRPNETKLTFSAVFELDKKGKVVNEWFGKTIIFSDQRFTYEEAQEIIEGNTENEIFGPVILNLNQFAQNFRKKRLETGALDVESQEVKFKLDEEGNPLGIVLKESKEANKLIEEFMLLANRRVAAYVGEPGKGKKIIPFVYRVHDEPDPDRISDLKIFLKEFGYTIQHVEGKPISYALNKVMDEAKEKDELHIIGPMIIRSMSKAIYDIENNGHYGLAFLYYTHFTSPIRRYADLLVHRILFEKLNGREYKRSKELEQQCKHISETEKKAVEAERASTKYTQVKFMSDKIGQAFEGKITGITDWGMYVELNETKCEGMVPLGSIGDGSYFLNEKTKKCESHQCNQKYHLGQNVMVRIKSTDIFKKQIDMILLQYED